MIIRKSVFDTDYYLTLQTVIVDHNTKSFWEFESHIFVHVFLVENKYVRDV